MKGDAALISALLGVKCDPNEKTKKPRSLDEFSGFYAKRRNVGNGGNDLELFSQSSQQPPATLRSAAVRDDF
jgi:hypothetical protein